MEEKIHETEHMPKESAVKDKTKTFALLGIEFSLEFIKTALIVFLLAIFFRFYIFQPFIVVGQSMEPNFHDKEYLVVDKVTTRFREPKRGEIVIFHPPQNPSESYIKRVIGLPGETVEVKEGKVYVDDEVVQESYILHDPSISMKNNYPKVTLGADEYYVFGDNREHSSDSREIGPIPKANLQGRVAIVLFPFDNMHFVGLPTYQAATTSK
jgi:signal peptidase I